MFAAVNEGDGAAGELGYLGEGLVGTGIEQGVDACLLGVDGGGNFDALTAEGAGEVMGGTLRHEGEDGMVCAHLARDVNTPPTIVLDEPSCGTRPDDMCEPPCGDGSMLRVRLRAGHATSVASTASPVFITTIKGCG